MVPKDMCSKATIGPIIVQQGCDRLNDINSERPNVWPNSKAMTIPIIVLHRYVPVQATQIMTKGMYSKAVTGRMT